MLFRTYPQESIYRISRMAQLRSITLQRALLAAVAISILVGIVPAGIALNGSLASALESRARDDLRLALGVFTDHSAAKAANPSSVPKRRSVSMNCAMKRPGLLPHDGQPKSAKL